MLMMRTSAACQLKVKRTISEHNMASKMTTSKALSIFFALCLCKGWLDVWLIYLLYKNKKRLLLEARIPEMRPFNELAYPTLFELICPAAQHINRFYALHPFPPVPIALSLPI